MSTVQVFSTSSLQAYQDIKSLIRDFKKYKQNNITEFETVKFGKDVSYNRPYSAVAAQLRHVHLLAIESKGTTSDRFLVYSTGYLNPDAYVVLAIFEPNAHAMSRNTLLMSQIAELAEQFRSRH